MSPRMQSRNDKFFTLGGKVEQREKARIYRDLQSPLADSNRRRPPLPWHFCSN